MIVISGDKDFGGLTEFGPLWGRGKVILLRYREAEIFRKEKAIVIVLSEAGYRIHRRGELTK